MLRRALTAGMFFVLLAWPGEATAQSDALMQAYNQGGSLYKAGRYSEALPYYRKALQLSEQEFGANHPTTAIFLNNLAELYRAQGRYSAAEPLYKRSMAIYEKALVSY